MLQTTEHQTLNCYLIVGTEKGSNLSNSLTFMGTEMQPGQRERERGCSFIHSYLSQIKSTW